MKGRLAVASLSFLTGLVIFALAAGWIAVDESKFHAPHWVIGACGAVFMLAGSLVAVPDNAVRLRNFLTAVFMTVFAAVPGWVAFGPGEREFGGSVSIGAIAHAIEPGASLGRIAFGIGAVLIGIWAAYAWFAWLRSFFVPDDRAGERDSSC